MYELLLIIFAIYRQKLDPLRNFGGLLIYSPARKSVFLI